MTHIIMALDECGIETLIGSFDTEWQARRYINDAIENHIEYRNFWIEELRDADYWSMRDDTDEFGCDLKEYR